MNSPIHITDPALPDSPAFGDIHATSPPISSPAPSHEDRVEAFGLYSERLSNPTAGGWRPDSPVFKEVNLDHA